MNQTIKPTERGKQLRLETLKLSNANGGYHYGGCFSAIEILISLFDHIMTDDDQFILSKGHACWPYYVLLRERGLNPKLLGHPTRDPSNGVIASTGSLGHGLPMAVGMALARKQTKKPGRIFVLMGDGECQEGTTYESMLIAGHHQLDNLTMIVDANGIQGSGRVRDILPVIYVLEGMAESSKWGLASVDGHKISELDEALQEYHNRPYMITAHTIKGKGVSFMEDNPKWHACWPSPDQYGQAIDELS